MSRAAVWAGLAAATGVVAVLAWVWLGAEPPPATLAGREAPTATAPRTEPAAAGGHRERAAEPTLPSAEVRRGLAGAAARSASADAESDTDARQPTTTTAPSVHLSGVARDELGFVLADHVVEVSSEQFGVEGVGVTDAKGRYRADGLTPGLKELRLLGPGEGDVWRSEGVHADGSFDDSIHLAVEERRLSIAVPESGTDDFVLRSRGHREILVTARLVDDAYRPVDWRYFLIGRESEPAAHVLSDAGGAISGLVTVQEDASFQLVFDEDTQEVLRNSYLGQEAPAPKPPRRYVPIELQLRTAPRQQDLGTLVVPRMAGLALTLVDGTDGHALGDASVRWRCTGGGLPLTEEQGELDAKGTYVLWSGRAAGAYELDVSATGYQPAHQVGVLVVGDGPQPLELTLERTR